MSRDDIQKLLGGYATGTLTPEEQQVLFEAALDDQELFDALAREQSLRDLLRDPAAKAHLLAVLDERPSLWHQLLGWWRPAVAVVAMAGLATVAILAVRYGNGPKPVIVAQVAKPAAPAFPSRSETVGNRPAETKPDKPAAPPPPRDQLSRTFQASPTGQLKVKGQAETRAEVSEDRREKTATALAAPAAPSAFGGAPPLPGAAPPLTVGSGLRDAAVKKEVQVTAEPAALQQAPLETANAQTLFYNSPMASQGLVSADSKDAVTGRFAPQRARQQAAQQGQQGQQVQSQPAEPQQQQAAPSPSFASNQVAVSAGAAAKAAQVQLVPYLGVRYRILRKSPGGEFVAVDPESLRSGDSLKVEFTSNDAGLLSVTSGNRSVLSRRVDRLTPYTTEPLPAGERELTVHLSRTGPVSINGAALTLRKDSPSASPLRHTAPDGAVFVVSDPSSPQLNFIVPLNYK
ncbi:MAG TPA: hypothetical protein VGH38_11725 [Bryobacteraceae bacterium]